MPMQRLYLPLTFLANEPISYILRGSRSTNAKTKLAQDQDVIDHIGPTKKIIRRVSALVVGAG